MIEIICDKCRNPLNEPGGLIFSPPIEAAKVQFAVKTHICQGCWKSYLHWLSQSTQAEKRIAELDLKYAQAMKGNATLANTVRELEAKLTASEARVLGLLGYPSDLLIASQPKSESESEGFKTLDKFGHETNQVAKISYGETESDSKPDVKE